MLQYRVAPNQHPAPLMDAKRAIRIVRSRAAQWNVDPEKIAILGFSAGGHLAGSLAVHWDEGDPQAADPLDRISARPDAAVLCYAVLSAGVHRHAGSFRNLLGPEPSSEMLAFMSLENHVDDRTPPTFLWHTAADAGVPVENSLVFAEALSAHKRPFELHVYPEGRHGLGLAPDDPHLATWSELCAQWLIGMGW
ncbi:MAG: Acetylxylan esterase precursor [candidate division BRC1 bacterium ADurb.BinA364]|nr:MAG: Acetylxylan esterase precursor [candidate division BRC1 bacterium ADurb.BinA364]